VTLQVIVWINDQHADFKVSAPTIPEAFALIPDMAAERGYSLLNDGRPVDYQVAVDA
jgi:hypothetical protein